MSRKIMRPAIGYNDAIPLDYLTPDETPPVHNILEALCLTPDDGVVDFGAGSGRYTLHMARYFDESKGKGMVLAFDFSSTLINALDRAAVTGGIGAHIRADCLDLRQQTLPIGNEWANAILAVNSIQYLDDPTSYLYELGRVLKPEGCVLIADWMNPRSYESARSFPSGPGPVSLIPMLRRMGFEARTAMDLEGYAWAIRATKLSFLRKWIPQPVYDCSFSAMRLGFAG